MYDNPKHIKQNRVNVRLNDFDLADLERAAALAGKQKTTLAHDLLVNGLADLLEEFKHELQIIQAAS